jgi:hypothetical protein
MRKYHDQVLRNIYKLVVPNDDGEYNDPDIYAELLKSSALPAHCYIQGFKNIKEAYNVCINGENTTERDLVFLTSEFIRLIKARTYKQHRVPEHFYNFIIRQFRMIYTDLVENNIPRAQAMIKASLMVLDAEFGYKKQCELLDAYEKENPLPDWYHDDNPDVEYQTQWKKYFDFRKTIRFGAVHVYYAIWYRMLEQIKKVGNIE